jgi:hypothetical protein
MRASAICCELHNNVNVNVHVTTVVLQFTPAAACTTSQAQKRFSNLDVWMAPHRKPVENSLDC